MGITDINQFKIPLHTRQYIEKELRMYKPYLSAINLMEEELGEIYQSTSFSEVPVSNCSWRRNGGSLSSIPENKALRIVFLESEIKIKHERVKKIEKCLQLYPKGTTARDIIEYNYFVEQKWSHEQIMGQVGIGFRNNYFRMLNEIQYSFGVHLGVL